METSPPPRIVAHLNIGDHSAQPSSHVDIDTPLFSPLPQAIVFQNTSPLVPVTAKLRLRNNDRFARRVKVLNSDVPYFALKGDPDTSVAGNHCVQSKGKVAPGMDVVFRIVFTPQMDVDYALDLVVVTEREKFVVPVVAYGARALLDLPDALAFDPSPVNAVSERAILVRNTGSARALFSTSVLYGEFAVTPAHGALDPDEATQFVVSFNPSSLGPASGSLLVEYDSGDAVLVDLKGVAQEVNVRLEKSQVLLDPTFVSLRSFATFKIVNRSSIITHFSFKAFSDPQEESEARLHAQLSLAGRETPGIETLATSLDDHHTRTTLTAIATDPLPFASHLFSLSPESGTIYPSSQVEITVTFCPETAGPVEIMAYVALTGRASRLPLQLLGEGMGPAAAFVRDYHDFEQVFIRAPISTPLVLENVGEIPARFELVAEDGPSGPAFAFDPPSGELDVNGSMTISATFTPSLIGAFSQRIYCLLDGASSHPFVSFRGVVIGPTFHADIDALDFGQVSFGFLSSTSFTLYNTSEIPMEFRLRVLGDGQFLDRQFDVIPSHDTIPPKSNISIQVDFMPATVSSISTQLVVDIEAVGTAVLSLPISAVCRVPSIELATPLLDFGACFISHPYTSPITLINESDTPAKYEIIPQALAAGSVAEYGSPVEKGIIEQYSQLSVPLSLTCNKLGDVNMPVYIRILGSQSAPLEVSVRASCMGPIVIPSKPSLVWGKVPVLTNVPATLTLANDSLIPARISASFRKRHQVFSVDVLTYTIPPRKTFDLVVTARLDDVLAFADELIITVNDGEGDSLRIPCKATGFGSTITSDIPLDVVNFGKQPTNRECTRVFHLRNDGFRPQSLSWSIPEGAGIFVLSETKFSLEPGEEYTLTLTGSAAAPRDVAATLKCISTVERKTHVIVDAPITATFVIPTLAFSPSSLTFVYHHDVNDNDTIPILTLPLTLTNTSPLTLDAQIKVFGAFAVDAPDLYLPPASSTTVHVSFNPDFASNHVATTLDDDLVVVYKDHPRRGDNHALVLPPASALAASSSSSSSSSAPALETSTSGSSSSEPGSVMRWDSVSRILFEFPFRDVKIDVHLDTLLPRLAELAEHGADRQAKVAAAEALHSIVLHMIGSDAKSTVSRDYSILYTHLFPVLLRLAADVDAFTRNLFYPLVLQLIHWFTSSAPAADDTLALLDAVVSAVCSPSSHLRELAAQYMAEFLKWAIKQSGSSGSSSSSSSSVSDKLSVRALLRHIFALAAHPSPFRRIGAADAYLAIYRLFREEPDLVSFYVLEMLRNVFVSLKLAASDPEGLGTQSKMKRVLTALCRIISYFSESLNAPHVSPSNEPRLGFDTLDDALMFLFQSTTSLHMSVRHAAIEALEALVPNTAKYLAKSGCAGLALFAHAESHLVAHSQQGGSVIPTPTKYFTLDALTSFHAFAARLTAALDGYIWILSSAMASVSDLSLDSSTSPLTALATLPEFLPALLDPPLALAAKQSPEAVASLRSTTTLLLVKMFVFVARVLETCESDTSPGMALLSHLGVLSPNSAFLRLLLVATLAPAALGFAVGNAEIRTQLPKVTQHLLILLSSLLARSTSTSSSSSSPLGLLVTAVQALFTDHPEYAILSNTPTHLTPPKEEEAPEFTATLIAGYKQLAKANLLEPVLSLSRDALTALLLDHAQEAARVAASSGTHEASPLQKLLNEAKVNLALSLDVAPGEVLARLTAQDPVAIFSAGAETDVDIAAMEIAQAEATLGSQRMSQLTPASLAMSLPSASQSQSQSQSQQQPSPPAPSMMKTSSTRISTLGEVFYSTYRDLVSEHMVSSPGSFIEPLTKATASQPHLMDALLTMLKALMTSRSLAAAHGRPFVTALLTHLPLLSQWWSPVDATPAHHRDSILSLLSHVLRLQVPALLDLRPGGPHEFAVPMLVTAFASLLDLNLPMRFRIRVLAPFPLLLKHLGPYPTQTIMPLLGALNTMVVNNFPMNSKELDRFSPAFTQYIAALDALLAALRVTGSIDLLEILLPVFQEVDHVHTHAIVETSAAMVSHLPHQAVADLFHYAFNLFRDATHPEQLRLAIVRTFCVPILEAGSLTLVSSLATRVIGNLMGIIVAPVAARQKALPGADLSILFCEATCAFNMVQVLFERLNLVFIKHNLNGAFLDSPAAPVPKPETFTGTELIKAILRSAHDAKVEAFSGLADDRSKQLRLEYHRAAYAAMVTVVMRTQEKEAVFTNFLFKENAGKGSFIWENIVDLDVTHAFEAQTSFRTVQARGTFATFTQSRSKSRRRAYRESTERYFHDSSLLSADPTGLFFLNPSQRIDSSLMPDDGEHEVPMEVEGGGGETEAGTTTGAEAEEEEEEESQPTQVKSQQGDNDWYELDTINSNTCMPLLLQLLDHLKKHFVDSFRTAPDASAPAAAFVAAMPKWMKMMWEKVRSPSTHGNVRLFLIKMILSEVSSTSPLSPCPRPRSTLGASSTRRRPKGTSP